MASISPRPSSSHLVAQPTGLSRRSSSSSLVAEKVERQQTISAHMASSKRGGSGNVGKKRAQPEETPLPSRPSSGTATPTLPDSTVRTSSQSPTKRRQSQSSSAHLHPSGPPPPPIQYFPAPLGASYDPNQFYAVVPQPMGHLPAPPPHYPQNLHFPHPRPPPHLQSALPPFASTSQLHHLGRPSHPAHPHLPSTATLHPHLAPIAQSRHHHSPQLSHAPSTSTETPPCRPSSPTSAQPVVETSTDDAGAQPKPKRKYTKKADFWIENGGPGRRGLLAQKENSRAGTPADETSSTKSTPAPAVASALAPAKATAGRRRSSAASRLAQAPASTSGGPVASGSSLARPSTPIVSAAISLAPPPSLPRTISAPALLTAEDGSVSLSSTQVLASDLAWLLLPERKRSSTKEAPAVDPVVAQLERDRNRKRLAAFEDGVAFFLSPQKENVGLPSRSSSPSPRKRASTLVPARIPGVGRVAIAQGSLQQMMQFGGARPVEEPLVAASVVGRPGRSCSTSDLNSPNWPDQCHPWIESESDRLWTKTLERQGILLSVQQYLESASDDGFSDDEGTDDSHYRLRQSSVSSASSIDRDGSVVDYWTRRGGKASSTLYQTNRRLKNSQSVPSLSGAFDPSDARHALLHHTQFSVAPLVADPYGQPAPAPAAHAEEEAVGPGSIACICRDHVAEGAMVECNGCMYWFHLSCLALNEADLGDDEWFCWRCAPAGDQLPTHLLEAVGQAPRTPKTVSPEAHSDDEGEGGPGTPATVVLEPSPMFAGPDRSGHLGTPLQRFDTPLLPSATGFSALAGHTSFQSPSYSRVGGHRLPPLPQILHGTPGPSRLWNDHRHMLTPRVPTHTRDHAETLFDLSSTPSRHLTRELPFGGTPITRVGGPPSVRGGGRGGGGHRLPSFGSFATPSQEFFSGLHASPHGHHLSSSSAHGGLPALDHSYLSSVDSSGPLSPYQPLSKWHHSPSIQSHYPGSSSGRPSSGRNASRPVGERTPKEQVRFGEPLEGLRSEQRD